MVLSVLVQVQLLRVEHIGLIFVQCWEKTSIHSLGHTGCHCTKAATCKGVTALRVRPTPTCSGRTPSAKLGAFLCIFVIFVCTSYSSFTFFYAYTLLYSDMNLNIQAKERVLCIFCITLIYDINLHFFGEWLATNLTLELEKPQTAHCPINWRNCGSSGPSPGLLQHR